MSFIIHKHTSEYGGGNYANAGKRERAREKCREGREREEREGVLKGMGVVVDAGASGELYLTNLISFFI